MFSSLCYFSLSLALVLLLKNIALKYYLSCLLISWHPVNFSLKASAFFSLRNAKYGRLQQCCLALKSSRLCRTHLFRSLPFQHRGEEKAVEGTPHSSLISPLGSSCLPNEVSVVTWVLFQHCLKSHWVS